MKKFSSILKRSVPWFIAAAIFYYLFNEYPPSKIYNALKFINIPMFCLLAISYFILMFFLDTFSISKVLERFGYKEKFRELLPARGTTYLIMIINYAAAQAAFAFYQNRKHGVPISKMLGIFSIIVVTDLCILATLAFVTTFFTAWPFTVGGMNIAAFIRIFTIAAYALFFLNLLLWRSRFSNSQFFLKLKKNNFLALVANTKLRDYVSIFFYRLPVHIFIMCGMFIAIKPFGATIPFIKIISNIPLIFFIGALPITPGGLGTSNAALVELLKPFIESPAIASGLVTAGDLLFSFSLVWLFANYIMKALTGVICLKFVSRDLFKPTPEETEETAEAAATDVGGNI